VESNLSHRQNLTQNIVDFLSPRRELAVHVFAVMVFDALFAVAMIFAAVIRTRAIRIYSFHVSFWFLSVLASFLCPVF
jgi:hypothetical protein